MNDASIPVPADANLAPAAPEVNGAPAPAADAAADKLPLVMYADRAAAEAARPADAPDSLRPFAVTHSGAVKGWVLARGYDHGLATVARIDGYTISTGGNTAVTKAAVAAKLAAFTDEELAALGLARAGAKGKGKKGK